MYTYNVRSEAWCSPRPSMQRFQQLKEQRGKDRCTISLEHRKGPGNLPQHFKKDACLFYTFIKTSDCYLLYHIYKFQMQKLPCLFMIFGMNGKRTVCSSHTQRILSYSFKSQCSFHKAWKIKPQCITEHVR